MKARIIIIALVLLFVAGAIWIASRRNPRVSTPQLNQANRASTPTPQAVTAAPTNDSFSTPINSMVARQVPGGPYMPSDPRWVERTRKLKEDPHYEWKTPISLYAKVLDQDGNPLAGATADVVWTDMSPTGSSHMRVTSDGAGLFSLTGISGKYMTVQVTKDGYSRAKSKGRSAFEFASFWEPSYYEPDPNNPVIFYMRKRGKPAPLVASEGKIALTFGTPSSIPMPRQAGSASPLKVTVFDNDARTKKWKAHVLVNGGGITPALEEFPFEAPKEGYQPSIDLTEDSPRPPGWQDMHVGGTFYIKTAEGYGVLKLRQIRGKKTLHYEVFLNAEGGTSLETAQP
jgi:hypothetical protein